VVLDAIVVRAMDAVEHVKQRTDADMESGFLADLAGHRFGQRLPYFDRAAGQAPLTFEGLVSPLHEHNAIAVNNHGADANHRPLRKLTQS